MQDLLVRQDWLRWIGLLILGFPLLMVLLSEAIARLERRKKPIVEPLRIVRNLVLPTLGLFLILTQVLAIDRTAIFVRLTETLMWVFVIYAVLTLVNILLFEDAKAGSWQSQVPKLFLDLSRFFMVLVGTAIVLSSVWGADLGGLLTALGVGSLVIGLALQDSLGNIFSGIALLFERPINVGDWVQIGDDVGKVMAVTWRSVQIQTGSQDLLVIPNSELAQGSFKNLSRPTRVHSETFDISFSYDDPPNKVKQILKQTALETEGVLTDPAPWVSIAAYGDFSIAYKVGLFAADFETAGGVKNEFATRLWYAAKRHNLVMPYPIQTEVPYESSAPTAADRAVQVANALRSLPGLSSIAPATLEQLEQKAVTQNYAKNEVVIAQGDRLTSLFMILHGHAEMSVRDRSGTVTSLMQLAPGDFFSEQASLVAEQTSDVTVQAIDDLEVLILDTETLRGLLIRSPRFATEIGEVMDARRKLVQKAKSSAVAL